jgi:pimeloyl-ACP methyl ester carboxylesterase
VHNAIPPGGGFEEGTPLLCLHGVPGSGRAFEHFLTLVGRDRSAYAPDLPGFGESDAPAARASIGGYAAALGDFLDTMRFRQIDVLGYQAGALLAAEVAIARPKQIRRIVLLSVPVLLEAGHEALHRLSESIPPDGDGSHLIAEWRRTLELRGSQTSLEAATRALAESLRAGTRTALTCAAVLQYPSQERLALITQPTMVVRSKEALRETTSRIRELLPKARVVEAPDPPHDILEAGAAMFVESIRDFLRG